MKRQIRKTEKTFWQEFCEYLATIYWPEAEETLPQETVLWEYKSFCEAMTR